MRQYKLVIGSLKLRTLEPWCHLEIQSYENFRDHFLLWSVFVSMTIHLWHQFFALYHKKFPWYHWKLSDYNTIMLLWHIVLSYLYYLLLIFHTFFFFFHIRTVWQVFNRFWKSPQGSPHSGRRKSPLNFAADDLCRDIGIGNKRSTFGWGNVSNVAGKGELINVTNKWTSSWSNIDQLITSPVYCWYKQGRSNLHTYSSS